MRLVPVVVGLVGTGNGETEVVGLLGGHLGKLDTELTEMGSGNLLVERLGEHVDTKGVGGSVGPESNLSQGLVGKRTRHDERRVSGTTSEVDQSTLGKEDDVSARLHLESVDLGLDLDVLGGVGLQPCDVNLDIEVTNVGNNGILLHDLKVLADNDVSVTGGGNEDVGSGSSILHGGDLVTGHGSLEGVDGIDLGNDDSGTVRSEGLGTTLSDISETGNDSNLTGKHDIGGSLDTIDEGLSTSVVVVELGLGDRVVVVDCWGLELAVPESLVEVVDTGSGLLRDTLDVVKVLGVLVVDQVGQITSIVEDHVERLSIGEGAEGLLDTPVVLLLGLSLPGKDGDTGSSDGSGSVVLGGEDVARRPRNLGTEVGEGLDEDSGLDGHVETSGDSGTLQGLVGAVLLSDGHETRHLVLSELDLLSAEGG